MKIIDAWKIELTLLRRNVFVWLVLLLSLPVLALHYNRLLPQDPGDALTSTAFIIQGGMIASMMLGFSLMNSENATASAEVFRVLPNGFLVKACGKCLALLTAVIAFCLVALAVLYTVYAFHPIPRFFYAEAVTYISLYFGLSFFVSGLVGMSVGSFTQSRFAYILLVICWLLLGPLNLAVGEPIITVLRIDFTPLLMFLNLGQSEPHAMYDPVYGLPLETERWVVKGMMITVLLTVFVLAILTKSGRASLKNVFLVSLGGIVLFVPLLYAYGQPSQVVTIRYGQEAKGTVDHDYYRQQRAVAKERAPDVNVHAYNIELHDIRHLSARVTVELAPQERTRDFAFTLYHRLRIDSVSLGGKTHVNFEQRGDQLRVRLPQAVPKEDKIALTFVYDGNSSPLFFANEQAMMLPSYFPWYPVPGAHDAMHDSEGGELRQFPVVLDQKVDYTLTYDGDLALETNLAPVKNGVWRGTSLSGLTVVGSKLSTETINGARVVYPSSMALLAVAMPQYVANIKAAARQVSADLGQTIHTDVPHIFFLSVPSFSEYYDTGVLLLPDQLVIAVKQLHNDPELVPSEGELVPDILVTATQMGEQSFYQEDDMRRLFVDAYVYWYDRRFGVRNADGERYEIEPPAAADDPQKQAIAKKLAQFIEAHDANEHVVQQFFRWWVGALEREKLTFPAFAKRLDAALVNTEKDR
ncbi:hypothetical protein [Numidum massiliense]|uniref:hypothetical protein n=1 Tax=Numidum massiliense TaxID=1522315 RepID=UPI0006D5A4D2|nr:hypothetical protein [Numidum massiliense]